mmetsp:Transcript_26076/g.77719  ORF Transcript_26076/g.77719 Transcript_26076/m.77719 type:complete len:233 (-) Transcript_26076:1096-1794(-)
MGQILQRNTIGVSQALVLHHPLGDLEGDYQIGDHVEEAGDKIHGGVRGLRVVLVAEAQPRGRVEAHSVHHQVADGYDKRERQFCAKGDFRPVLVAEAKDKVDVGRVEDEHPDQQREQNLGDGHDPSPCGCHPSIAGREVRPLHRDRLRLHLLQVRRKVIVHLHAALCADFLHGRITRLLRVEDDDGEAAGAHGAQQVADFRLRTVVRRIEVHSRVCLQDTLLKVVEPTRFFI